jgi:tRNA threonylcarbamoyladenosine biosynthesis protein TsaE
MGHALRGGEVLALHGDLGTGKTALVSGIAAGLGAPPRSVSSPTFVFVQLYQGRLPLAHADLYRLESSAELGTLGLSDLLDGHTVVAIEWADKAGGVLPEDRLELHLSHRGRTSREIRFVTRGSAAAALSARVRRLYQAPPRRGPRRRGRPAGRHPASSA